MTAFKTRKTFSTLRKRARTGSAVIESVLVLMLLLNVSFGVVEFGWWFYVQNSFAGAARQGARAGIVPGAANSDVTTAVSTYMTGLDLANSGYAVKVESPLGTSCTVGNLTTGTDLYITVYSTWSVAGSGCSPLQLISASKIVTATAMEMHE